MSIQDVSRQLNALNVVASDEDDRMLAEAHAVRCSDHHLLQPQVHVRVCPSQDPVIALPVLGLY